MVVRHARRVEPADVCRISEEKRREWAAADSRTAPRWRGIESPQTLRGIRLEYAEASHDHPGARLEIVRAAHLRDRTGDLFGSVVDLERHPLRFTHGSDRGRTHFHQ